MDDFFRNLKEKLSIDSIIGFMKDAKVIDERLKEEDVRKTLEKMNPNQIVNVDELTTKISSIAEQSKSTIEDLKTHSSNIITSAKSSLSVLQKPSQQPELTEEEEMAKHEDIISFYN